MTIIYLEDWLLYDPINQTLHLVECGRGSRYLIEKMKGLTYEEQTKLTDKIRKKYEKGMSESLLQKWNHIVEVAIHYRPDVVAKMKFLKYEYGCLTMINKFWMDRRILERNVERIFLQTEYWPMEYYRLKREQNKENTIPA